VLKSQGVPTGRAVPQRVTDLASEALRLFRDLARPRSVTAPVSVEVFREIYPGEGRNDGHTPLAGVFPEAHRLVLFAATIGAGLSNEIERLLNDGDLALAAMLDGAASEGTERLVGLLETSYATDGSAVLSYSPGYCGWHVTGQKRLFDALRPEAIGITLNTSCLMSPLKSVSGVLVAGPSRIHEFNDDFACCSSCPTRECRARIARVVEV
jgi:hypothetical protein